MKKKILGILMSLALVAQVLAVPTFAATSDAGLIISTSGAEALSGWKAIDSTYASVSSTTDAVRLTVAYGTQTLVGIKGMVYPIPETQQINFSQDNTVIVEADIAPKVGSSQYIQVRFNAPEDTTEFAAYKDLANAAWNVNSYYQQVLGGFAKNYVYGANDGTWGSSSVHKCDGSITYKLIAYITSDASGKPTNIKTVIKSQDEQTEYYTRDIALGNNCTDGKTVLENIAITVTNSGGAGDNEVDVHNFKVYNVPNADVNDYHKYDLKDLVVSDVKIGGADLEGATNVTAGNITFTATGKGDITAELSYVKNDYAGTTGTTAATFTAGENNSYTLSDITYEKDATYTLKIADTTGENSYTFTTAEEAYTAKYGLVAGTEGTTTHGFTLYNTTRDTMSAKAEGYVRVAQGAQAATTAEDPAAITYSLGDNKIKFSDEDTIVIETRVRAGVSGTYKSYGPYLRVGYNIPKNASESVKVLFKDNVTTKTYDKQVITGPDNKTYVGLVLGGLSNEYFYGVNGSFSGVVSEVTMNSGETSPWYKMVTTTDGITAKTVIYDDLGVEKYSTEADIVFRSLSEYLENISFSESNPQDGKITTDVDYIRVYNMPDGYEAYYADYNGIVSKEDILGTPTNGVITLTDVTAADVAAMTVVNRDGAVKFVATMTGEDTAIVRVKNPLVGDVYKVTVAGVVSKYEVTTPYIAELTLDGFTTDAPEAFQAEGAVFYKANYDSEGRLVAVEAIPVTTGTTTATVVTDNSSKVFLWDANMKPIMTYQDTWKVGFIGGSLTEQGNVWRAEVADILEEHTGKEVISYAAGKGGTNSMYGAARFGEDIAQYEPDMVFIEFAVNDFGQNRLGHITYMESMIRQCLLLEKTPYIVFLYSTEPCKPDSEEYATWKEGVDYKNELAAHYGIKTINVYDYVYSEYEADYADEYPDFHDYLEYLGYKRNPEGSAYPFDVHAGFHKYAEAIRTAYEADEDGFFTKPRNPELLSTDVRNTKASYNQMFINDENIVYTGWNVATAANPGISAERHYSYPYFSEGILETTAGGATFTVTTDADQIAICYPSSKLGNTATYTIDNGDGVSMSGASANNDVILTKWIKLSGDGAEHTVTITVDTPAGDNNVFRIGSVIEYYEGN